MSEPGDPDLGKVREALFGQGWSIVHVGPLTIDGLVRLCTDITGAKPLGYEGTADCRGVNRIGCGQSRYMSDSNGAIGLHSEEYQLESPLRWLSLYCNRKAEVGGASWFVDFRAVAERLDPGAEARIRYRRSGSAWTDWLPLWNARRISFAVPQANREVELRDLPGGLDTLLDSCRDRLRETLLNPGDLMVVDNARMLHGRAAYSGGRCFWRVAC